jgi:hypothetical protein
LLSILSLIVTLCTLTGSVTFVFYSFAVLMTLFLLLAILLGFIIPYFQRRRARLTFSSHRRRYYMRKATITTFWGVASLLVAFFLWFFRIRL